MEKTRVKFKSHTVSIAPDFPVPLSGYYVKTDRISDSSSKDLELNFVIVKHKNKRVAFVSADLLFMSQELCEIISSGLGLGSEKIMIGATHTHFAPGVDSSKKMLGKIDKKYKRILLEIVRLATKTLKEKPYSNGVMEYNSIELPGSIHRRKKVLYFKNLLPRVGFGGYPNPRKQIDRNAHLVKFKSLNGRVEALLWQFACHPVGSPNFSSVDGDYPSKVREKIRGTIGNASVIFFQGFSGDIRPIASQSGWSFTKTIKVLLNGGIAPFGQFTPRQFNTWVDNISKKVLEGIDLKNKPLSPAISYHSLEFPLKKIFNEKKISSKRFMVQYIKLSETVTFIGLSAEVCNDVAELLPNLSSNVIKVGCLNEVFGYLPTSKIVQEGGYESEDSKKYFGLEGSYKIDIDDKLKQIFRLVLKSKN